MGLGGVGEKFTVDGLAREGTNIPMDAISCKLERWAIMQIPEIQFSPGAAVHSSSVTMVGLVMKPTNEKERKQFYTRFDDLNDGASLIMLGWAMRTACLKGLDRILTDGFTASLIPVLNRL